MSVLEFFSVPTFPGSHPVNYNKVSYSLTFVFVLKFFFLVTLEKSHLLTCITKPCPIFPQDTTTSF